MQGCSNGEVVLHRNSDASEIALHNSVSVRNNFFPSVSFPTCFFFLRRGPKGSLQYRGAIKQYKNRWPASTRQPRQTGRAIFTPIVLSPLQPSCIINKHRDRKNSSKRKMDGMASEEVVDREKRERTRMDVLQRVYVYTITSCCVCVCVYYTRKEREKLRLEKFKIK